ncbi:MAG: hypothetical protein U1G07_21270 [Verrucomicrobiota bacterium]
MSSLTHIVHGLSWALLLGQLVLVPFAADDGWDAVAGAEESLLFAGALQLDQTRYADWLKSAQQTQQEAQKEQRQLERYQWPSTLDNLDKAKINQLELKPALKALQAASESLSAASPDERASAEARVQSTAQKVNEINQRLTRIDVATAQRALEAAQEDLAQQQARLAGATEAGKPALLTAVDRCAKALAEAQRQAEKTSAKDYQPSPPDSVEQAESKVTNIRGRLQKAGDQIRSADAQVSQANTRPAVAGIIQFRARVSADANSVLLDSSAPHAAENFVDLNGERLMLVRPQLTLLGIASDDYIPVSKNGEEWGRLWMGRFQSQPDGTIQVKGTLDDGRLGRTARYYVSWIVQAKR